MALQAERWRGSQGSQVAVVALATDPTGGIVGDGGVLALVVVGVLALDHLGAGLIMGLVGVRVQDMATGLVVEHTVVEVEAAVEEVVVEEGRTTMAEILAARS